MIGVLAVAVIVVWVLICTFGCFGLVVGGMMLVMVAVCWLVLVTIVGFGLPC